jgi:hypothetical protein
MDTLTDLLNECRDDPDHFNELFLNRPPYWRRQKDLCRSVVDYRVTAAYSGNMVGKDYWIAGCGNPVSVHHSCPHHRKSGVSSSFSQEIRRKSGVSSSFSQEIRCQFIILDRKDEPTPDFILEVVNPATAGNPVSVHHS